MRLAVVIPVYNERDVFPRSIARLDAAAPPHGLSRHLVVVDDGSTDGTADFVRALANRPDVTALALSPNRGKGAALREGFRAALESRADFIIVQDADLEYDPADHGAVLGPLVDGRADAVVGSRFLGQTHRVLYYWHSVANKVLTTLCNMATNLNLTDIECGTKAFTREVLAGLALKEDRFGIEPEIVARLARARCAGPDGRPRRLRIFETPVSYWGRTYEEGKKIRPRDGAAALRCILQYGLLGR